MSKKNKKGVNPINTYCLRSTKQQDQGNPPQDVTPSSSQVNTLSVSTPTDDIALQFHSPSQVLLQPRFTFPVISSVSSVSLSTIVISTAVPITTSFGHPVTSLVQSVTALGSITSIAESIPIVGADLLLQRRHSLADISSSITTGLLSGSASSLGSLFSSKAGSD